MTPADKILVTVVVLLVVAGVELLTLVFRPWL